MICLLLPPQRSQAGPEKWGENSFLQSHMGLCLKALICCRSEGLSSAEGLWSQGAASPFVRPSVERRSIAKVHVQQSRSREAASQPTRNTLVYTKMGINRANPTLEVVSHWAYTEVTRIRTEVLFAMCHRIAMETAENQQSFPCQVANLQLGAQAVLFVSVRVSSGLLN